MSFDIEGARKAGYSDAEIADHLSQDAKFDAPSARKAGYTDAEIIGHLTQPAPAQVPTPAAPASSNWAVTNKGILKGIAGGVDTILNLPTNVYNLAKAAVGAPMVAAGLQDYAPDVTPAPNLMNRALLASGMLRPDVEVSPQTPLQRVLDVGGQFAGGSLVNPASSARQAALNVGKNALTGLLSGATKEATGSDLAALGVGLGAPMAMAGAANAGRQAVQDMAQLKSVSQPRIDTLAAAQKEGLVVPPTSVNPSITNTKLESVAGKAATQQAASVKNQPIIDNIARREAGLKPDEPLTPDSLASARATIAQPYNDLRKIGNLQVDVQYKPNGLGPTPFTGGLGAQTIPADKAVDAIKQLRADGNAYFKQYGRDANPETLAKAQQNTGAANQLEGLIERNLQASGNTDLLQKFRDARVALAKNYQVENALREGGGTIDPKKIAQSTQRGDMLTGGLKTIGDFANNFPKAALPLYQIGSPGVSKLEAAQSLGTGGLVGHFFGPAVGTAAAVGALAVPPAVKATLLSAPYQAFMAKSKYTPSMMAQMLSKLPPDTPADVALQAITSGRITTGNRLSDLLGSQ